MHLRVVSQSTRDSLCNRLRCREELLPKACWGPCPAEVSGRQSISAEARTADPSIPALDSSFLVGVRYLVEKNKALQGRSGRISDAERR
jgi:hypothetical protein